MPEGDYLDDANGDRKTHPLEDHSPAEILDSTDGEREWSSSMHSLLSWCKLDVSSYFKLPLPLFPTRIDCTLNWAPKQALSPINCSFRVLYSSNRKLRHQATLDLVSKTNKQMKDMEGNWFSSFWQAPNKCLLCAMGNARWEGMHLHIKLLRKEQHVLR